MTGHHSEGILEKGTYDTPSKSYGSKIASGLRAIKPTFFPFCLLDPDALKNEKLRPATAWLDGLRGFMCFLVFCQHHHQWAHFPRSDALIVERAWGFEGVYHFVTLPGVRFGIIGGHYAVVVFFIISGYVLSWRPMQLIHQGDYAKLGENLGSALFRRHMRLWLPICFTTFVYMTIWHVFDHVPTNMTDFAKPTWRAELWDWYVKTKNFSFIFDGSGNPIHMYDVHTWSIPLEMKGSIVIYTVLQAISRATRNRRLLVEAALIFYFSYIVDGWYCAIFMFGMFFCDLDMLAEEGNLPAFFYRLKPYKTAAMYFLLAGAIWFGSSPTLNRDLDELRKNPGWYLLSYTVPQAVFDYKHWFLGIGAVCLVACVPRISWMKSFCEGRFCQYMGKLSFSFYLTHGPILWFFADMVYVATTPWFMEKHMKQFPNWVGAFPLPHFGIWGLESSYLITATVLFVFTCWVAEIGVWVFDEPSVRFAQSIYRWTLGSGTPSAPIRPNGAAAGLGIRK